VSRGAVERVHVHWVAVLESVGVPADGAEHGHPFLLLLRGRGLDEVAATSWVVDLENELRVLLWLWQLADVNLHLGGQLLERLNDSCVRVLDNTVSSQKHLSLALWLWSLGSLLILEILHNVVWVNNEPTFLPGLSDGTFLGQKSTLQWLLGFGIGRTRSQLPIGTRLCSGFGFCLLNQSQTVVFHIL